MRRFIIIFTVIIVLVTCAYPAAAEETHECIRLPIVMYHHMSPKEKLWGDYVLEVDQFERDLFYLKQNGYESVTVNDLLNWCGGQGELPEKPVMITFDDGFESTWEYAVPLLEKYGMKGVVSIIGCTAQQYTDSPDHNMDYSHMSWEKVAEASKGSILEVQCHTWNMHHLYPRKGCSKMSCETPGEYRAALCEDIESFQDKLCAYTGRHANALALPFGAYVLDTLQFAGELGFDAVLTCTEKVNYLTGSVSELMELGRYNRPSGLSSEKFFSKWEE